MTAIDRMLPRLRWLEQRLRPRAGWVLNSPGRRVIGLATLLCGILILLPVPFGNTAPAVAVVMMAAGWLARDGIMVLAGLGCSVTALALDVFLIFAGVEAFQRIAGWFG